mmetsp:Transcript_33743/g.64557  ORF Transcript_33743/g.64557 Transcript_33743/m.64557 type:complete len:264 (+) Transcript_33743:1280-2071(+)
MDATIPIALSFSTPVGCPCASLRMAPPAGGLVWAATPASASAALFARPRWPSTRVSQTGMSPVTRSTQFLVGISPPQISWSQPFPRIHPCWGTFLAASSTTLTNSAGLPTGRRSRLVSERPPRRRCTCASMNPGVTKCPCKPTWVASTAAYLNTFFRLPAATTRPSLSTPSASNRSVCNGSPVQIFASMYTIVASRVPHIPTIAQTLFACWYADNTALGMYTAAYFPENRTANITQNVAPASRKQSAFRPTPIAIGDIVIRGR